MKEKESMRMDGGLSVYRVEGASTKDVEIAQLRMALRQALELAAALGACMGLVDVSEKGPSSMMTNAER